MEPSEVIQKLNEMKDVLMERGWSRCSLEDNKGRLCLLGARNLVVCGSSLQSEDMEDKREGYFTDEVTIALTEVMPDEFIDSYGPRNEVANAHYVYMYNDKIDTQFNDVMDLIDQAIVNQKDKL